MHLASCSLRFVGFVAKNIEIITNHSKNEDGGEELKKHNTDTYKKSCFIDNIFESRNHWLNGTGYIMLHSSP